MAQVCDACGEQVTRSRYWTAGPLAMKTLCQDCLRGRGRWKKLSWVVSFRFKIAKVLPKDDPLTVPMLRLLMAVDDVRRAQVQLIEAHERLDGIPAAEKYRAVGDFLYALRLLFSHLHEAARAMRALDGAAKDRVDGLLRGNQEALSALQAIRTTFNDKDYRESLVARLRNGIGFHYRDDVIRDIVDTQFTEESLLESTAAQVGGLARVADPFVKAIIDGFAGGDFMADERYSREMSKVLDIAGNLLTFVDHLFNALLGGSPDSIVEKLESVVDIPVALQQARAAVDDARRKEEIAEGDS